MIGLLIDIACFVAGMVFYAKFQTQIVGVVNFLKTVFTKS